MKTTKTLTPQLDMVSGFLFDLIRDHLPLGAVEALIARAEEHPVSHTPGDPTSSGLMSITHRMARRLLLAMGVEDLDQEIENYSRAVGASDTRPGAGVAIGRVGAYLVVARNEVGMLKISLTGFNRINFNISNAENPEGLSFEMAPKYWEDLKQKVGWTHFPPPEE